MEQTLKYLRESHGFTKTEVADFLGITRQMYAKYENGDVEPTVAVVRKLCDIYKVSYDVLMEDRHKDMKYPVQKNSENLEVAEPAYTHLDSYNYSMALQFIDKLKYEELFKVLKKIVDLMDAGQKKSSRRKLTREESLALVEELSGCIKCDPFDYKQAKLDYLDEKYAKYLKPESRKEKR